MGYIDGARFGVSTAGGRLGIWSFFCVFWGDLLWRRG